MIVILTIYPLPKVAGQPGPDSGYVSHSSGGGYPKLQVGNEDKNCNDYDIVLWGDKVSFENNVYPGPNVQRSQIVHNVDGPRILRRCSKYEQQQ